MTPLEREVARQRARLAEIERQSTAEVLRVYTAVAARLARDLRDLVDVIERATAKGIEVRPVWLFAQARHQQLIEDLGKHTDRFLADTARVVTTGQRAAVAEAFEDGQRLARLALGPAPRDVLLKVTGEWDRMPTAALDRFIGRATDGSALGDVLADLSPLAPRKVKDTLAYGVAAGKNPRVIAREVQQAARIAPNRALVIARTEIVQAHRQATTETWEQTGVVQKWRWQCARDARTCAACWAMDGTEHPLGEPMGSHPCCRCARIPQTASWADLGFPGVPDRRPAAGATAADAFRRMSYADRLAVLGRAKLDAYNNGQITLADLVRHTHSDRWGNGIRAATIGEVLA